ncbi:PDDEXK nuclease domain-containing protein [Aquisphaera insulae]|uniref:PDDEXK nuclease domain-containing protein n=1 Tax=Aquisphaera insulae TaxID=2712864 RepID=UPI00196A7B08|nr:PDDEXK nuclease domain-containing protein [Aquisphaera insulae]
MSKSRKSGEIKGIELTFEGLVRSIRGVDDDLAAQASRAVNLGLTLRNWLIGCYIAEYELRGSDRAAYGERLLDTLAAELGRLAVSNCNRRQLYRYLRFYRTYPEIVRALSPQFRALLPTGAGDQQKVGTPPPRSAATAETLLSRLSYSHLELVVDLDDAAKREFYVAECLRGGWSVRELKRQIASLYFERSDLSRDKAKLKELVDSGTEQASQRLEVRDPYVFEFLGLKPKEVMSESHLEDQLLDRLQDFLLELGHGFCFEARQKRILIGDHHGFIDLVFYHRILKCHVLIELKLEGFSHENIGQLNTYVSWYARNVMTEGDNPPVGILLCTQKDHALVEYALAGMDNRLFVSKYQLHLPDRDQLRLELERSLKVED